MHKLDSLAINANIHGQNTLEKVQKKLFVKKKGDESLLIKIMLMVIAVVLVIVFRDALKDMITTLLSTVKERIQAMYTSTTVTP